MDHLVRNINYTFNTLIQILLKVDEEDLDRVPTLDSWSIGEVVEHVIICSNGIPDRKTEIVSRNIEQQVPLLKEIFLNSREKFKADDSLMPREMFHDKYDQINEIKAIRKKLSLIARKSELNGLCLDMEFPSLGFLTRYEWLSFICFHTQRHIWQIESILAVFKPAAIRTINS